MGNFNEIRDGAIKPYNTVVPIAHKVTETVGKVVDYAKPYFAGTKAGDKIGLKTTSKTKTKSIKKRMEEIDDFDDYEDI